MFVTTSIFAFCFAPESITISPTSSKYKPLADPVVEGPPREICFARSGDSWCFRTSTGTWSFSFKQSDLICDLIYIDKVVCLVAIFNFYSPRGAIEEEDPADPGQFTDPAKVGPLLTSIRLGFP